MIDTSELTKLQEQERDIQRQLADAQVKRESVERQLAAEREAKAREVQAAALAEVAKAEAVRDQVDADRQARIREANELEREVDRTEAEALIAGKPVDFTVRERIGRLRDESRWLERRVGGIDEAIRRLRGEAEHRRQLVGFDPTSTPELCRTCCNEGRCRPGYILLSPDGAGGKRCEARGIPMREDGRVVVRR